MTEPRRYPSSEATVPIPREEITRLLRDQAAHKGELRCPACAPAGWSGPCPCCRETRFVSKAVFGAFHARTEGRPSETTLDSYDHEETKT